jgi:DNA-binding NtrC family response regulator
MANRILVVDDEPGVRLAIRSFFSTGGYDIEEASSIADASRSFRAGAPDVAIVDYWLPDGTALELLRSFKLLDPDVPLLILSGNGTIDLAVQAVKEGADQFLTKPIALPALKVMIERSLESARARRREAAGRSQRARSAVNPFVGTSSAIQRLEKQANKLLGSDCPILVLGATGVGKGVLARWLHEHSPRANQAFVDLNCAGLSTEFLESELFGHEKGAFTGAAARKPGMLEVAHQGTVFLDEIGDMDARVQPKLLKVLEEKRFRRLGDVHDRVVDIRLIAATHQDLEKHVREGRFRSDLYFRINTVALTVPQLRDRAEDIPVLAKRLLEAVAAELGIADARLTDSALAALQAHRWPGNIRELRNVLERALLLGESAVVDSRGLAFDLKGAAAEAGPSRLTLSELERQQIKAVLEEEGGRVAPAAERLGIPKSTMYQKLKHHGLSLPKSRNRT